MGLLSTIFIFLQALFARNNTLKVNNKNGTVVSTTNRRQVKFLQNYEENVDKDIGLIIRKETESSSSTSTESIIGNVQQKEQTNNFDENRRCGPKCHMFSSIFLSAIGVCSVLWTPFEILMNERIRMRPGLPAFEWWKNPPDEVFLKVFVYNVTNSEDFINKKTTKLQLQEIGPIIYREKLIHTNVIFNDNSTITYTAVRTPIFLPEYNDIDLNQQLIVPNFAMLGMASYLWNAPFFVKLGFNVFARNRDSRPFVNISIYDYLWNFTDPLLRTANTLMPHMVPVEDMGMLSRIYSNFVDNITIYMGTKYGHEMFSLIDNYDGSIYLPNYENTCQDTVQNSTEGVTYSQYLTKNSTLRYWRKTMCKVFTLHYSGDFERYGLKAYKYDLPSNAFDNNEENACYATKPRLPNGLIDISKCYFDFPIAASFPHFLHAEPSVYQSLDGMRPNETKHSSFAMVEPTTGIALTQTARSQSNLVMRKMSGFNDYIHLFSEMVLPMFWAEYTQAGLPWNVRTLIYFTVNVLPYLQNVITTMIFLISLFLIYRFIRINKKNYLNDNELYEYEKELFLLDKV